MGLRIKKFEYYGGSLKIPIFRGVMKNQYIGGGSCLEKGAWTLQI